MVHVDGGGGVAREGEGGEGGVRGWVVRRRGGEDGWEMEVVDCHCHPTRSTCASFRPALYALLILVSVHVRLRCEHDRLLRGGLARHDAIVQSWVRCTGQSESKAAWRRVL